MIYSNEQAKLFTDTQYDIKVKRTANKKQRQADAAERAEAKIMLQEMNAWTMDDLGVEL
jgi:hypothetical protein